MGAIKQVLARPVVTGASEHAHLVHLSWQVTDAAKQVMQVYVDGRLYDVCPDANRCVMWLVLDRSRSYRIELRLVDASAAWQECPPAIADVNDAVHLAMVRDETLPTDSRVVVLVGGEVIDEQPLWDGGSHRGGFGALFGEGGFGLDAATGPGVGLGELGFGPFGSDGQAWRWRWDDVPAGSHELTVRVVDANDQTLASHSQMVEVTRLPEPGRVDLADFELLISDV